MKSKSYLEKKMTLSQTDAEKRPAIDFHAFPSPGAFWEGSWDQPGGREGPFG